MGMKRKLESLRPYTVSILSEFHKYIFSSLYKSRDISCRSRLTFSRHFKSKRFVFKKQKLQV